MPALHPYRPHEYIETNYEDFVNPFSDSLLVQSAFACSAPEVAQGNQEAFSTMG